MFRTRCLSLMYCVNLAETSHTHQSTINPIQPGMIWTVNYLGGGGLCDPPVYLDNYATYRYEKLHTNNKKTFSF